MRIKERFMEKSITINSKEYKVPEFNFGTLCELEDLGIDFGNIENKSFGFIRALVAITINADTKKAENEINAHLENGGSFDDFTPILEAFTTSDFFQKLSKKRKN